VESTAVTELQLTDRQRVEADVYNARVRDSFAAVRDDDLTVDASVAPFPNREHVDFLSFALSRLGDVRGRRILEVGIGSGALSVHLALRGARVTGIDVAEENVVVARRRATANGVAEQTDFRVVPVEQLADPDATYDGIIGNQVLHHFELPIAMANIRRMLRPGGRALFCEPVLLMPESLRRLRDSGPVKRVFPKKVDTPTERSISPDDVAIIRQVFPTARLRPFQLFARLQNFVELDDSWFGRIESIDRRMLRTFPALTPFARFVVFELSPAPTGEGRR
jgi:2-polyprenyl-3-methyl-5-hydroxy-6-metoxy-1,4-benzoquinol methylase